MRKNKVDPEARDTEQAGTAERIAEWMRSCHTLLGSAPLPIAAVEGLIPLVRYVNPAFCRFTGKTKEEVVGKTFGEAMPKAVRKECSALLERVQRTGASESLMDQEHFPSLFRPIYWSYAAWTVFKADEHPDGVMIQITDTTQAVLFRQKMLTINEELLISDIRQHELMEATEGLNARLKALAATDGLTGLKNHRAFQERLGAEVERAVRYAMPLSLLLMDVDKFKDYNDTYGHPAGDAALCRIGEILQATARTNDQAARYGGEEFAIILPETDAASARLAGERFRAAIEDAGWQERQITVSVGAATLSPTTCDTTALIVEADKALYLSKERGRNRVTHNRDG